MDVDKNKKKGSFALTGSQAFELMKDVSETLAGRMAIIELEGLSLREIHHISFNQPFIPNDSYIKTYIEKDVRQIIHISNELKFIKFFDSIGSSMQRTIKYQCHCKRS